MKRRQVKKICTRGMYSYRGDTWEVAAYLWNLRRARKAAKVDPKGRTVQRLMRMMPRPGTSIISFWKPGNNDIPF